MMNLLSIFDPSTYIMLMMNWISLLLPLMMMPMMYWFILSRLNMLWIKLMMMIYNEFKLLISYKYMFNMIIFLSMLMMISLYNLMGLMPYTFTPTSHLSINLSLTMSMWLTHMFYGWTMNWEKMLIHLVPLNTPLMLMNLMVLIETISNIIRPWALSIRLTANMLAGYLLLTLLGSSMESSWLIIIPFMIIIQNMLFILEISVLFIQSYVISILSLLYFNESNH